MGTDKQVVARLNLGEPNFDALNTSEDCSW